MRNIYILFVFIMFFSFSIIAEAAESDKPVNLKQSVTTTNENMNTDDKVSVKDVYEVLLKTKDDKIIILSNYVNWLIAIAAIVVTILTVISGWFYKKFVTASNKATKLIKDLEISKNSITEQQEKINKIFESGDYIERVEKFEKTLEDMENRTSKWDQEIKSLKEQLARDYKETNDGRYESSSLSSTITVNNSKQDNKSDLDIVPRRGDIYFADFLIFGDGETKIKNGPCLVVQNDIANDFSNLVTVIPIIADKPNLKHSLLYIPIEVEGKKALINISSMETIEKKQLITYIASVDNVTIKKIEKALLIHFGI